MDFLIDTASRLPIYRQLVERIHDAAARGDLKPGDRLPSVRQMARDIVVNPNTVARAYAELENAGLIVSRQGLGVFLAEPKNELTKPVRQRRLTDLLDKCLAEAVHLGFERGEVLKLVDDRSRKFQWNGGSQS